MSFPVLPPTTDNAGLMTAKAIVFQGKPAIQLDWTWDVTPPLSSFTYDELIQFIDPLGDPADPYNQSPGVPGYQVLSDEYYGAQGTGYPESESPSLRRYIYTLPDGLASVSQTLYFGAYQGDTFSEIFCGINYVASAGVSAPPVEGALAVGRNHWASRFRDTIDVVRLTDRGTFNPADGSYDTPGEAALYSGPALVRPASQRQVRAVFGDIEVTSSDYMVHVPWDTPPDSFTMEDTVTIGASPTPDLAGKQLRILHVAYAESYRTNTMALARLREGTGYADPG